MEMLEEARRQRAIAEQSAADPAYLFEKNSGNLGSRLAHAFKAVTQIEGNAGSAHELQARHRTGHRHRSREQRWPPYRYKFLTVRL